MVADRASENLSGFWTGVYDYPDGSRQAVAFNVVIEDKDGTLTGEIIEPNTFSPVADRELFAHLAGAREGSAVHFVKTYEKVKRGGHSISYEGTLDASCTRIEGIWRAVGVRLPWSGPFIMNRGSGKKVAEKMTLERTLDLVKQR